MKFEKFLWTYLHLNTRSQHLSIIIIIIINRWQFILFRTSKFQVSLLASEQVDNFVFKDSSILFFLWKLSNLFINAKGGSSQPCPAQLNRITSTKNPYINFFVYFGFFLHEKNSIIFWKSLQKYYRKLSYNNFDYT